MVCGVIDLANDYAKFIERKITFRRICLILAPTIILLSGLPVSADNPLSDPYPTSIISDGTLRRIRIPILMYHYVSSLPENADQYRIDLTIEPALFDAHMAYLRDNGYTTISLYQLHEALLTGTRLPEKPIILTFDDGYSDHYVNVFPILQKYGFIGTFFVITGRLDNNDSGYLTWSQISEMQAAGMSMESHSKSHPDLRNRDYDFLVYELLGSLESIRDHVNQQPHMFAYPSGRYDDYTLDVLETLPVWRAVTTQHGSLYTTDNYLELPRLRVSGNMGVAGLAQLLNSTG